MKGVGWSRGADWWESESVDDESERSWVCRSGEGHAEWEGDDVGEYVVVVEIAGECGIVGLLFPAIAEEEW